MWKLGKPSIVKKSKHILKAVRYSNTYLDCEFRQGDKEALFNGYVRGYPKVKTFMWYWMRTLHEDAVLDMETTIDKIILTPLEGPLDLLDLRPSDCKNPVEAVDDWI